MLWLDVKRLTTVRKDHAIKAPHVLRQAQDYTVVHVIKVLQVMEVLVNVIPLIIVNHLNHLHVILREVYALLLGLALIHVLVFLVIKGMVLFVMKSMDVHQIHVVQMEYVKIQDLGHINVHVLLVLN